MTSKEMEQRSGVARANIRYYEAEGLLAPRREKNGYRDYSEQDLAVLEKIKLLRRLGVSIEELKALFSGQAELAAVLERRLEELRYERQTLRRVEEVCGALQSAGETFATLEPEKYLQALDAPELAALPAADALPTVCSIPRRFLARLGDYYLCVALIVLPLALAGVNLKAVSGGVLFGEIGAIVLLGLLEPVCLRFFAATPGKALMGLRITRPDGSHLSWQEGFERYLRLLWEGLDFSFPSGVWYSSTAAVRAVWTMSPSPGTMAVPIPCGAVLCAAPLPLARRRWSLWRETRCFPAMPPCPPTGAG